MTQRENLLAKVQTTVADAIGTHFWRDYRNLYGFAASLVHFGHEALVARHSAAVGHLTQAGAGLVFRSVQQLVESLESYALEQRRVDRSMPASAPGNHAGLTQARKVAAELAQIGSVGYFRDVALLCRPPHDVIKLHVERSETPQRLQVMLVAGAIDAGLDTTNVRYAVRPWLIRDSIPTDDRSLAFEAALDCGHRVFAHDLFT